METVKINSDYHYKVVELKREIERLKEKLRCACNSLCSCGGGGPEDEHTCDVCKVWHRMMAK